MNNIDKQLTSDQVDKILKEPLLDNEDDLLKLYDKVRQNMHSRHAETQSYKQCLDFLKSIEFRLHWLGLNKMYEMNKKMFWIALVSSAIAFISMIKCWFKD